MLRRKYIYSLCHTNHVSFINLQQYGLPEGIYRYQQCTPNSLPPSPSAPNDDDFVKSQDNVLVKGDPKVEANTQVNVDDADVDNNITPDV